MQEVTITLPEGVKAAYPYGTRVEAILGAKDESNKENPVVAAMVNNKLVSLSFKVEINAEVEPVHLYSPYGNRI
ncbi:MAG: hypothetical protein ACOC2B_00130 [Sediminispirochaetaceae bacterium]